MGKVYCPCGNCISDVTDPNYAKGELIGDIALEALEDEAIENKLVPIYLRCAVMDRARDVWECDACGRIAIDYPEDGPNKIRWWKPETDGYAKLVYPSPPQEK